MTHKEKNTDLVCRCVQLVYANRVNYSNLHGKEKIILEKKNLLHFTQAYFKLTIDILWHFDIFGIVHMHIHGSDI
jgi:hypothetical protein